MKEDESFKEHLAKSPMVRKPKSYFLWFIPAFILYLIVLATLDKAIGLSDSVKGVSLLIFFGIYHLLMNRKINGENHEE